VTRPVELLDSALRRAYGIFEYSSGESCIFRLRLSRASHALPLGGTLVAPGAPLLELHFWNERLPALPEGGAHLAWGKRLYRVLVDGLRDVARHVRQDSLLRQAQAVGGSTLIFSPTRGAGTRRLLERHGFVGVEAPPAPMASLLSERLFTWMLLNTYQAGYHSLRETLRMQKADVWIPMGEFLRRFGTEEGGREAGAAESSRSPTSPAAP